MHLLAAKPGGFSDDEGIIDLGQTPGDIVVLSAADSSLAALAAAAESMPAEYPAIRLANWLQLVKPAALDLYRDKVIDHAKVVIVSLLGGQTYWQYGFEQLQEWASGSAQRQLIFVPGDDALDTELIKTSTCSESDAMRIWRFLREGGTPNNQQLFYFIASQFFGFDFQWREPQPLPRCSLYLPGNYQQTSIASYKDWEHVMGNKIHNGKVHNVPVAAIIFYKSHLQSANTAIFDQLINLFEKKHIKPLPIAVTSLKDNESITLVNALIAQSGASIIVNTTGFASNTVASPELSSEPTAFNSPFHADIPVLQLILSSTTEEDWQDSDQGLRSRDIAMQIVLPEMDGRVVTRAISFKAEDYYSERCEIAVIRYQIHQERADFVAALVAKYCALTAKPNREKRIAFILANYPTKDGRIGNGVGLDTPASTVNILNALKNADYPIENIPESGTQLITELLGAVTNNPNTLHLLPCWQSIAVDEYLQYFSALPNECQQAVWDRWGAPENDPKHRNGRLMLAGIRLGETFIGIQPARGYNIDLSANYHDPDLIPPHSYLAFYFWLRHCYQVDAMIHVGKHGNLEWLPGKGSALSNQCWPDIALGPMPHFYPFIVNDPGEGAQAKRRTQAVIIDHLMPPMTRAETYGELAELESLVDEYYQALGMDTRREIWLRDQIIKLVAKTNLIKELGVKNATDTDEVLNELDAYLCEIKEAQIRHGLHILGELPSHDKTADTLVALLRLPRGSDDHSQGILHCLSEDLNLKNSDVLFDPFNNESNPWHGEKPLILTALSDQAWRTEADTRERLELLARSLILSVVLKQETTLTLNDLNTALPRTYKLLQYGQHQLFSALNKSVEQELSALIKGLEGRFVEPGPSGAPTRGRLDTLPTGRNFFSVDNRSIPSPAAWAIGERSAQALIERHLQEQGDYPKQLGLSVWGTATMRTGGDDIAQAFALMGIKPIWAPGSQRVVDFEIIPCMMLGRPRVDVTLRVSGFFRDAFPNVMRLYDAAILALADYEDPGGMNTVQKHIKQRTEELQNQGHDREFAIRQASYRVFGSKPGAYGAGLQGLIDERCWETRADLAEAYLNWGGYAYGSNKESAEGVAARNAFHHRLSHLEGVVQNQDNREHDILDSDDYYQFQGGMTNAVAEYAGLEPIVYHNDHSNPSLPKVRTLKEELNRVIRSRVLNPKWVHAMREHGYKGAFEMAATVDYLFAYDATTNLIDDYQYADVAEALVFDKTNQAFMLEQNPSALEEMAERLLEATQRGLWQQSKDYSQKLQDLLLDLDESQEGG